jgi:alpha-D-xyloside xylohydrolase
MPKVNAPPIAAEAIAFREYDRGCVVELPMDKTEQIFGFGAGLPWFNCTNTRKTVAVNDSPEAEDGSSHGPVPYYVSTRGYAVFVDTLRCARFYCGNLDPVKGNASAVDAPKGIATTTEELYKARTLSEKRMTVDIPVAKGVDIYVFAGPAMRDAVSRYNLFSGGGCLPPLWGLGMYYRGFGKFKAEDILKLAHYFREKHIPVSVFGLEPGWHSHAYSCTYTWSKERWPDPGAFLAEMTGLHYQLNLWEHAFVHPSAPFHNEILPYSGDYRVWQGLVPDFTLPQAREIFGDYHEREFVKKGVTGFKLDECDNQPNKSEPWSFPELTAFPSGMDGEQMHALFGLEYQRVLTDVFKRNNIRTYGKVRATHALAAPSPFVLYSDAYEHKMYTRGILTAGFCGLLWQPELRVADSIEEMYRRLQTAIFSPQAVVDAWFMPHPAWQQINAQKNEAHELMPGWESVEDKVRVMFQLRMQFIPYLYSAFAAYRDQGIPPFRALVMDFPDDTSTWKLDDEYLVGPDVLVAPLFNTATTRAVYLPKGIWYCFWTGQAYEGGKRHDITMPPERVPLFVRQGALLPLAEPVEFITPDTRFSLTVRVYGTPARDFVLYEDDGFTYDFERGAQNRVVLHHLKKTKGTIARSGDYPGQKYEVREWVLAGE